jgi:hypothetical protein
MKKPLLARSTLALTLIMILNLSIPQGAQAGIVLKVGYSSDDSYFDLNVDEEWELWTANCIIGSACAKKNRALSDTAAKARAVKLCKTIDGYNARVKVTTGSGSTAGLGNLKSVSIVGFKKRIGVESLPDYESEYEDETEDPEYIEDGYEFVYWEGTCRFSGNVPLISSSFYTVYVNGALGPEYSKTELAKLKWSILLVDS